MRKLIKKVPVYYNPLNSEESSAKVHLIQYPTRPRYRPYGDQGTLELLEQNPSTGQYHMTYSLHTNTNYDSTRGTGSDNEHHLFSEIAYKHNTDSSSYSLSVAINSDDAVYILPISHSAQLRPIQPSTRLRPLTNDDWQVLPLRDVDSPELAEYLYKNVLAENIRKLNSTGSAPASAGLLLKTTKENYIKQLTGLTSSKKIDAPVENTPVVDIEVVRDSLLAWLRQNIYLSPEIILDLFAHHRLVVPSSTVLQELLLGIAVMVQNGVLLRPAFWPRTYNIQY